MQIKARLTQFSNAQETDTCCIDLPVTGDFCREVSFAGAHWQLQFHSEPVPDREDATDLHLTANLLSGSACEVALAVEVVVDAWSREHYLLVPAAVYNGNRYPVRAYSYPPIIHEPADGGPDAPIVITDVPRLSDRDGTPSRIQLLTGDATTPCIAFRDPHNQTGCILLTEQGGRLGNHGLTIEENVDRSQALLRVEAPGVRRETLYTMATTQTPSWDRGADWAPGQQETLRLRIFSFPAPALHEVFRRLTTVRKELSGPVHLKHELPFSAAWEIIEQKYHRDNWCEAGYFRVGTHEAAEKSAFHDWQIGWVGGGMVPLPLLIDGNEQSRARAIRNLDWLFTEAQHPNGLFHSVRHGDTVIDDSFKTPGAEGRYMVRKQGDALYFLIKTFLMLQRQQTPVRDSWTDGARRLADRLLDTYQRFGQLGMYLDRDTADVAVGGSTAAAIVPGAWALASEFFQQPDFLQAAQTLGQQLYERDAQAGFTHGGPGEILKNADSESAFALLESLVTLFEVTRSPIWLERAEAMAAQCLSWCAAYDYRFPPESPFGKLDIRAAGSVWANVQNKHCAPAICTFSGDSLFRLFRHTGNRVYLEQIQETAHNLLQYMSRDDRPVGRAPDMRTGYMCERVNFSDWEGRENIGGSLFGSCWSEVSLLLTLTELPGIYVQTDTGLLTVFDHLNASLERRADGKLLLSCHNPTAFDARTRVFCETSTQAATTPLPPGEARQWPQFTIPAHTTCTFELNIN